MGFLFSVIGLCIYVALILVAMLFQTLIEALPSVLVMLLSVGVFIALSYVFVVLSLNGLVLLNNQISSTKTPLISFSIEKNQYRFERYLQAREQGTQKPHFLERIWQVFFYIFIAPVIVVVLLGIYLFPFAFIAGMSGSYGLAFFCFFVVTAGLLYFTLKERYAKYLQKKALLNF